MFFSSDGLLPMKTSLRPPDVLVKSAVSYSSTILATLRLVRFTLQIVIHSTFFAAHSCLMSCVAASGDRVVYGRFWPQLAPDAAALRGRRRQEAVLLDDWDVAGCTVRFSKCSIKSIFFRGFMTLYGFWWKNTHLKSFLTLFRSSSDNCFWLVWGFHAFYFHFCPSPLSWIFTTANIYTTL